MNSFSVEDIIKHVAVRVRALRKEQKLTQEELAVSSGVDVRSIQRIENRTENVSLTTIIRVSLALDVTLSELFDIGDE